MPLVGVPQEARHGGPTIKGVGAAIEATSPDVDALLAGFSVKGDALPKKKARESGPNLDGSPRDPRDQVVIHPGVTGDPRVQIEGTPRMPDVVARAGMRAPQTTLDAPVEASRSHDTDTFSSQESDTRRLPKRGNKLAVPLAIAVLAVIGGVSFLAYRGRSAPARAVTAPPTEMSSEPTAAVTQVIPPAVPVPAVTAAMTAATAPTVATVATVAATASSPKVGARAAGGGRGAKAAAAIVAGPIAAPPVTAAASALGSMPSATAAAAAPVPATPPTTPKPADTSFVRGL
jgi:hypothetical protein